MAYTAYILIRTNWSYHEDGFRYWHSVKLPDTHSLYLSLSYMLQFQVPRQVQANTDDHDALLEPKI